MLFALPASYNTSASYQFSYLFSQLSPLSAVSSTYQLSSDIIHRTTFPKFSLLHIWQFISSTGSLISTSQSMLIFYPQTLVLLVPTTLVPFFWPLWVAADEDFHHSGTPYNFQVALNIFFSPYRQTLSTFSLLICIAILPRNQKSNTLNCDKNKETVPYNSRIARKYQNPTDKPQR